MAPRISRISARFGAHERGIFDHLLVGLAPTPNPKRVWIFGVPCQRTLGAVHFEPQARLAARTDLRNCTHTVRAALETQQDGSVVVSREKVPEGRMMAAE